MRFPREFRIRLHVDTVDRRRGSLHTAVVAMRIGNRQTNYVQALTQRKLIGDDYEKGVRIK